MKIIEELETKRGLYSGAVGYFTLMAILTLMWSFEVYCTIKKINTFSVGKRYHLFICSRKEYEECLLKSKAMREVLE
jgi:para-aminobenzoate synthetase component 1